MWSSLGRICRKLPNLSSQLMFQNVPFREQNEGNQEPGIVNNF